MNKKLISIITVCYNSEETIERCIKSIISQNYENYEYIIIDGKSSDNTINIINKYSNKHKNIKVISEKDNGIYDAMNKGLRIASGDWVIFINSDDWMEEDLLSKIDKYLNENNIDAIYGNIKKVDKEGNIIEIAEPSLKVEDMVKIGMPVFHQAIFINRNVYLKLGNFNTDFKIAGDWDFIARMFNKGFKFKYTPLVFSNFTLGGTSSNSHIYERHIVRKKNNLYKCIDFLMFKEYIVKIKRMIFTN